MLSFGLGSKRAHYDRCSACVEACSEALEIDKSMALNNSIERARVTRMYSGCGLIAAAAPSHLV